VTDQISDVPLALLLGLDYSERVWSLTRLPPPHELFIAAEAKMSASVEDVPSAYLRPHRVFRLARHLRSRSHRWWEVYNEGRSRTPQDGFVYLEVSRSEPAGDPAPEQP
jgi:hypothetical protein